MKLENPAPAHGISAQSPQARRDSRDFASRAGVYRQRLRRLRTQSRKPDQRCRPSYWVSLQVHLAAGGRCRSPARRSAGKPALTGCGDPASTTNSADSSGRQRSIAERPAPFLSVLRRLLDRLCSASPALTCVYRHGSTRVGRAYVRRPTFRTARRRPGDQLHIIARITFAPLPPLAV